MSLDKTRSAPASKPLQLTLISGTDGENTHLEVAEYPGDNHRNIPLKEAVKLILIDADKPLTRAALRKTLGVNNHRLGLALCDLEKQHIAVRNSTGWTLIPTNPSNSDTRLPLI